MYRRKFEHTNFDFFNLSFLKIQEINTYFAGVFTFKSLNNISEPFNYFQSTNNIYALRNNSDLRPPFSSSQQGQSSPSIYCCHIWNNIPVDIRSKPTVASFKFAFKHYLLNIYNN